MVIQKITTTIGDLYEINKPVNDNGPNVDKITYFKDGNYYNKGQFFGGKSYVVYIGDTSRILIPETAVTSIELDRTEDVIAEIEKAKKNKKSPIKAVTEEDPERGNIFETLYDKPSPIA